jgi:hypothetical protein
MVVAAAKFRKQQRAANLWFSFRSEKVFKKALLLLARGRQRTVQHVNTVATLKTLYISTQRTMDSS